MNSIRTLIAILTIAACSAALAQPQFPIDNGRKANLVGKPDLRVRGFKFPPSTDKALRVHIVNAGNAASGICVLRLTVRKINGTPVGRVTEIKIPAIAAGKNEWFVIDAASILPNNVALESTTFKLNVDATKVVVESDESNNETWHNL